MNKTSIVTAMAVAATAWIAFAPPVSGEDETDQRFGTVHFATSCNETAQRRFDRAMRYQHSFWYQSSKEIFEDVLKADPACGIAYWGIALSLLYNPHAPPPVPNLPLGLAALQKAKAVGAGTQRERDYIDALTVFYTDYDKVPHGARVQAYLKAMEALAARYPDDDEAQIFYALYLAGTQTASDQTYSAYLKAAAILEKQFAKHPNHPGAAHYLIHSYDAPPIAVQGLPAARRYAAIAPDAPHALHMPSHIFTRVGAWTDSATTNRRAEETARRSSVPDDVLHAIDYQVYAALQLGRDAEAKRAIERGAPEAARYERNSGAYGLAASTARYAMERGDWKTAAQLKPQASKWPYADAMTHFARAVGAARSGDAGAAQDDAAQLAKLRDVLAAGKDAYWTEQVEIQRLAAQAWIELAQGRREPALALMRQSADRQDAAEKATVTPGHLAPSRELLGEMLLELNQPAQALKEFEASAVDNPNRFRGTYGAALAAARAGNTGLARERYRKLVELAGKGDARAELQQATTWLSRN